ncbi:MAG: DinB family protein [Promethearchaeota archaeon]
MKRKLTKVNIIDRIRMERRRLEKNIAYLSDDDMQESGVIGEWSVKDILAHLFDWEHRFLGWYDAGLRGEVPETPAPGLKWSQLRILNQQVFEKHRDRKLKDVKDEFQSSFKKVLDTIERIPENDIFEIGRYKWTGKENIGGYILANTANHYRWAKSRIRSWMKRTGRL